MSRMLKWVAADGTEVMLDGSTGVSVRRGASGLDAPARSLSIDERVAGAGGVLVAERTPTRVVDLPLHINLSVANLSTIVRAFRQVGVGTLVAGSGRELRNVVYESGLEGLWDSQHGGVEGMGHRQFPLNLLALDPLWYGQMKVVPLTLGAQTAWSPHLVWSPHIPWSGGGSQTLFVEGEEDPFPVWTAIGPVDNLSAGIDTGRSWGLAVDLTAGAAPTDVIQIDHRPGSRGPKYGSELIPGYPTGLNVWSLLTQVSRVDWPLPVGVNSVVLGGANSTGATEFYVSWEELWYSP